MVFWNPYFIYGNDISQKLNMRFKKYNNFELKKQILFLTLLMMDYEAPVTDSVLPDRL